MADPVFSTAHKVVIDCVGYLATQIHDNDQTRPDKRAVLDILADALPQARSTGHGAVDRLMLSASGLLSAERARKSGDIAAAMLMCAARMDACNAFAAFAKWRLGQSWEKFQETGVSKGLADAQ